MKKCAMVLSLLVVCAFTADLSAGGCPLTGGGGGGYSRSRSRMMICGGNSKPSKSYVVYQTTDIQGNTGFGTTETSKFKAVSDKAARDAAVLRKALVAAQTAWKKENPNIPFPLKKIGVPKVVKLSTFVSSEKAAHYLGKKTEQDRKKNEMISKALEKRNKGLTEKQIAALKQQEQLSAKALSMLKKEMASIIAGNKAKEGAKKLKTGQTGNKKCG